LVLSTHVEVVRALWIVPRNSPRVLHTRGNDRAGAGPAGV